ncbi:pX [Guinea pig adenovirus 1]|uniref:PX n=1 Tax=Guinea pig adenovirus 1 TaxID=2847100 RepID=A0AC61M0K7_9ADEN|nr:pX [Guinea pig adenovirus]QIZ64160.1 pX [Guinea pig adenovirus 1]QIZ64192.1 pX [Guinea pig adenovirus]
MTGVTYRVRIPVRTRRRRRVYYPTAGLRLSSARGGAVRYRRHRRMRGGFLAALAPIIAAAIGAIPGIASVAMAANRR